jgi:hypothetical protein
MLSKLERKLGFLGVPYVTEFLCIGQIAMWVLIRGQSVRYHDFSLIISEVLQGQAYRLVTFVILPETLNPFVLLIALSFLWFAGNALAQAWGLVRYNLYLICGFVLTAVSACLIPAMPATNYAVLVSTLLAFSYLYPDYPLYVYMIIPVKAKYLALLAGAIYASMCLKGIAQREWMPAIIAVASVANFLLFFGPDMVRRLRNKQRGLARRAQAARDAEEPFHRCSVCKRTDKSHPRLEFRYFPTAEGTKCFCAEHYPQQVPGQG